ncbi:winged helix-turn-helix domain-containing protein [Spongiactinospora sp. 9N601]|uniref:winged helix-turn-helix domain-containing protein n=1 Tax=Spongiactinospora sp. 9N601 TaxID=3375149 RepID=UPI003788CFCC
MLYEGPAAHCWARISAGPWRGSSSWSGRSFEISYTLWRLDYLLHWMGWRWQMPPRRAAERNEQEITPGVMMSGWREVLSTTAKFWIWPTSHDRYGRL